MRLLRRSGLILLATGFVMLAIAALIRDPTALDANIGAGGLTLIGLPIGAIGLGATIGAALAETLRRPQRD